MSQKLTNSEKLISIAHCWLCKEYGFILLGFYSDDLQVQGRSRSSFISSYDQIDLLSIDFLKQEYKVLNFKQLYYETYLLLKEFYIECNDDRNELDFLAEKVRSGILLKLLDEIASEFNL